MALSQALSDGQTVVRDRERWRMGECEVAGVFERDSPTHPVAASTGMEFVHAVFHSLAASRVHRVCADQQTGSPEVSYTAVQPMSTGFARRVYFSVLRSSVQ